MQIFNCGLHYNASLVFLCHKNTHIPPLTVLQSRRFSSHLVCRSSIGRLLPLLNISTNRYTYVFIYIYISHMCIYIYIHVYLLYIYMYTYIHVYLSLGFCFPSHLLFRECGRSNSKAEQDDGSIASTACGSQSTTPPCGSIDVAPCSMRT